MWDLIVSVPDHCLSFYFDLSFDSSEKRYSENRQMQRTGGGYAGINSIKRGKKTAQFSFTLN